MTTAPTTVHAEDASSLDTSAHSAGPAAARPSYRPFAVEIESIEDISPSFRRLTLRGPELHHCADHLLDQRIKLLLGEPLVELTDPYLWFLSWRALPQETRPIMRTYTLSGVDRDASRVTVDLACRPAHGPASRFAAAAEIGTRFIVVGPDATHPDSAVDGIAWHPGQARDVLLVGDETALPAIRNILRSLPDGTTGRVVLDLPHLADAVELSVPDGVHLDVVARDPRGVGVAVDAALGELFTAGSTIPVARTAERSAREPDDDMLWDEGAAGSTPLQTYAWLAGEAGWIATLRRRDRQNPVPGRTCSFMGYWRTGRAESTD